MKAPDSNLRLAENLRKLRGQKGWSQLEFANRSGLDRTYVCDIENQHRNVTLETLDVIAATLEVPSDKLIKNQ